MNRYELSFPGTLITRQRLKRLCSHTLTLTLTHSYTHSLTHSHSLSLTLTLSLSLALAPPDITFIAIFFSFCSFVMAHKDLEARLKSIFFSRDKRITLS